MTVTPLSRGGATVTVSATDFGGSNTSATQTFSVSVDGGGGGGGGPGGGGGGGGRNRGPQVVETLGDRTLEVGEALVVDLAQVFEDRDGDVLTFGAESSAPEVVVGGVVGRRADGDAADCRRGAGDADGDRRGGLEPDGESGVRGDGGPTTPTATA